MNDLNAELKEKLETWRTQGQRKVVRVIGRGTGRASEGRIFVQQWSKEARGRLAILALAVCWGLALLSALIPFINFVSVPLLAILGPFIAWRVYSKDSMVVGGLIGCPRCGLSYELGRGRMEFPIHSQCTYCQERAEVLEDTGEEEISTSAGRARSA